MKIRVKKIYDLQGQVSHHSGTMKELKLHQIDLVEHSQFIPLIVLTYLYEDDRGIARHEIGQILRQEASAKFEYFELREAEEEEECFNFIEIDEQGKLFINFD